MNPTHCSPCDALVVGIPTEDPRLMVLVEYEEDGYTPSSDRHICWPREQRIGRLIVQRRARAASAQQGTAA